MHLRSLSLRNYRVYRAVDLEFPDGLIGIYGPNGSGKSTLIEALRWALYGDSRTDKWELRSAGVGEDVRVELVFEHEGNTFDVRRRLKGRNLTPEVEVFLNGQLAAQSVREANAYLARNTSTSGVRLRPFSRRRTSKVFPSCSNTSSTRTSSPTPSDRSSHLSVRESPYSAQRSASIMVDLPAPFGP